RKNFNERVHDKRELRRLVVRLLCKGLEKPRKRRNSDCRTVVYLERPNAVNGKRYEVAPPPILHIHLRVAFAVLVDGVQVDMVFPAARLDRCINVLRAYLVCLFRFDKDVLKITDKRLE